MSSTPNNNGGGDNLLVKQSVNNTSSPSTFVMPDVNKIYLGVNKNCDVPQHGNGHFCIKCRCVATGWTELPWKIDENGKRITVGPKGGLLEGVALDDEESIAVICVMVKASIEKFACGDIPGFPLIMDRHPKSVAAGERIADLYFDIQQVSPSQVDSGLPSFWSIIETVLGAPETKASDYITKTSKTTGSGENLSDGSDEDSAEDSRTGIKSSERGEGNESDGGETESESGEDEPGQESDGGDGDGLEAWASRPFRTPNQAHAPAEKGKWKLAPGTDTSKAFAGKPDPSKFFIVRHDRDDPGHVDIREYTYIRNFDWDEASHVAALNKHRKQIFKRTDPSAEIRPQWSLKEKNVLEDLIKTDLESGKTSKTLHWKDLSQRLSQAFVGVTQQPGEPLAQTMRKVNGKGWISAKKTNAKVPHGRFGPVERSASAIKAQARKFPSISELLDKYPGGTLKGGPKRKGITNVGGDESVGNGGKVETGPSAKASTPLKKRKIIDSDGDESVDEDSQVAASSSPASTPIKKRKVGGGMAKSAKDERDDKDILSAILTPTAHRSKQENLPSGLKTEE